jgi:probable addiction module antidote protein
MKETVYKRRLRKRLADPEAAAEFLTLCFNEGTEAFLLGLKEVVDARGGMTRAARMCNINRKSLYRVFSTKGNPRLSSLDSVLLGLDLKVVFVAGESRV